MLPVSNQSISPSHIQNRHNLLLIFRFMFFSFSKGVFPEFQKNFFELVLLVMFVQNIEEIFSIARTQIRSSLNAGGGGGCGANDKN